MNHETYSKQKSRNLVSKDPKNQSNQNKSTTTNNKPTTHLSSKTVKSNSPIENRDHNNIKQPQHTYDSYQEKMDEFMEGGNDEYSETSNYQASLDNEGSVISNHTAYQKSNYNHKNNKGERKRDHIQNTINADNTKNNKNSKHRENSKNDKTDKNRNPKKTNKIRKKSANVNEIEIPRISNNDTYFPIWNNDNGSATPNFLNDIIKNRLEEYPTNIGNEEDRIKWKKARNMRDKMKLYDISTRKKLFQNDMVNPIAKFNREKYVFINKIPEHRQAFQIPKDPTDIQKSNVIQTYLKSHAAFILSEKALGKGGDTGITERDKMKLLQALNNPLVKFLGSDYQENIRLGNAKHEKNKHKRRVSVHTNHLGRKLLNHNDRIPFENKNRFRGFNEKRRSTTPIVFTNPSKKRTPLKNKIRTTPGARGIRTTSNGTNKGRRSNAKKGILKTKPFITNAVIPNKKQGKDRRRKEADTTLKNVHKKKRQNKTGDHMERDPQHYGDNERNDESDNDKREDNYEINNYADDYSNNSSRSRSNSSITNNMEENTPYYNNYNEQQIFEEPMRKNNVQMIQGTNQYNVFTNVNPMNTMGTMYNPNAINVVDNPNVMNLIEIPGNVLIPPPVYEHPNYVTNTSYMNVVAGTTPMYSCYPNTYNTISCNYPISNVLTNVSTNDMCNPIRMQTEKENYVSTNRNHYLDQSNYDEICSNDSTITQTFGRSASSTGSSLSSSSSRSSFDRKSMRDRNADIDSKHKTSTRETSNPFSHKDKYSLTGKIKNKNNEDVKVRLFLKQV